MGFKTTKENCLDWKIHPFSMTMQRNTVVKILLKNAAEANS